jgi:peptidoglycan/xylan/chitin deacetylase (PgdA/CDA1 family)
MLNYRNTLILFIVALSCLVLRDISAQVNPGWYIGIVLALITLLALGSIFIKMGFYLTSHCSGIRERKEVAFTFDDGPDNEVTPLILDILKEQGITAAFFVIGSRAVRNPGLIKRMDLEGHIIGGHGFLHHFFFDLLPAKSMKNELKQTADIVQDLTGKRAKLFRPPYGVTNPALARAIRSMGFHSIGWSLKSKDTLITDENVLLYRLKKKIKPGDVILFHDTKPVLLEMLPKFIACLKKAKFQIVRPDQLLNIEAYE